MKPVSLGMIVALGVGICVACATGKETAPAAAPSATAAAPAAPFRVKVVGHGPPLILIPGLASPGEVWDGTVAHFQDRYTCHVLTLAGFGGVPAIDGPVLPTVREALARYIREQKLERPVVVGHSLGGVLAVWLAASEPDLLGQVVVVDSLPFLPASYDPDAKVEQVKPRAAQMRDAISRQSPEQFRASQVQTMQKMITDEATARRVAELTGKSDPRTVAEAMYEVMTTDLRPELSKVKAPVLVVGTWEEYRPAPKEAIQQVFESQYAGLAHKRIVLADHSLHFVQLDAPAFLFSEMDTFLAGNAAVGNR